MDKAQKRKAEEQKRTKRRGWKWWLVLIFLVVIVVSLGFLGVTRYYPQWNQQRLLKRAEVFLEAKDYNAAVLTVQRVLALNPENVAANVLMVELAKVGGRPEDLLFCQRRLAQVQPEKLENHLAAADTAIQLRNLAVAKEALASVSGAGKKTARYREVAGKVALVGNDVPKAIEEFSEALKLEPENPLYQLNLAQLRLGSPDPAVQREARGTVEALQTQPELAARASRMLIEDAWQNRDGQRALALASTLQAGKQATFEDRLIYLNILDQLKHPEFARYLTSLQEASVQNPSHIYQLIIWMNDRHRALLAIEWSKRLPASLVVTMPVPQALAQSYMQLGDWEGLKPLVSPSSEPKTKEGEVPSTTESDEKKAEAAQAANWAEAEFMRLALLSRILREEGKVQESTIQWISAIKAAGNRTDTLSVLARAANGWGWEEESQELLWTVGRTSKDPRWALDILYRRYAAKGATRNMYQVLQRIHEVAPAEGWVANNLANFSLLLESETEKGIKLAEEIHRKEPQNSAYSATYSYALHLQGRTPEALALMKSLGDEKLQQPEYAAYYGILLAGAGQPKEARRFLDLGAKAALLPEERKLVEQASAKVGRAE